MFTQEHVTWLGMFNPCGVEIVKDHPHRICPFIECRDASYCMSARAYQMAGFLINDGTSAEYEQKEFGYIVRDDWIGRDVLGLDYGRVRVDTRNYKDIVQKVGERATCLVQEVDTCVRTTDRLTPDFQANAPSEQQLVLSNLKNLNDVASEFKGSQAEATLLEEKLKRSLEEALDMDLGDIGLIARYAIALGLGNRVLQGTLSQIIVR